VRRSEKQPDATTQLGGEDRNRDKRDNGRRQNVDVPDQTQRERLIDYIILNSLPIVPVTPEGQQLAASRAVQVTERK